MNYELKEMIGKRIYNIDGLEEGSERVEFIFDDGTKYIMYHVPDCCEVVELKDVSFVTRDFIGAEIIDAYKSESDEIERSCYSYEVWTFYRIATEAGPIVMRWVGESNGYYSMSVCETYEEA